MPLALQPPPATSSIVVPSSFVYVSSIASRVVRNLFFVVVVLHNNCNVTHEERGINDVRTSYAPRGKENKTASNLPSARIERNMRVSAKSGSSNTNFPTIFGSSDGICRITSCHVPDHRRRAAAAAGGDIIVHDRRATMMRGEAAVAMFDRRMDTNDIVAIDSQRPKKRGWAANFKDSPNIPYYSQLFKIDNWKKTFAE